MQLTPRQRYLRRWALLKAERATWIDLWRELADHIQPRRSRFLASDRNKSRRNDKIINSTPIRAARVLASGMMAGVTSPARPWFRLTTPDPALADLPAAKAWLHQTEELLRLIFARSNVYNALHNVYTDLGWCGTSAMHVDSDPEDVLRAYVYPVGQYALATSARLQVDTVYRELSMTVGQLVEKFGYEACSEQTRAAWDRGETDTWREVLHVVEPNRDWRPGRAGPRGMRYRSCWLELGVSDQEGFLRESGYEEMATLCPRWDVTGEDVYGSGPGMDALGDCKALQLSELRQAKGVDKIVDPPMVGPATMQGRAVSLLPGAINYVDIASAGQKFEPAMVVHPQAIGVGNDVIARHEHRINAAFYADLWLMMMSQAGTMTAREVAERHEEKMLQLGPVLERLQDELLDPLIDRAFGVALRNGYLPPPPKELQGAELRVEYISILAQAQKLLGVTSIERLAAFVAGLGELDPSARDLFDPDEAVRAYGEALGTPPRIIRTAEVVQRLRQQRAEAQAQQQALEQAAVAAQGAKTLADTTMEGDTALNRLLGAFGAPPPAAGAA